MTKSTVTLPFELELAAGVDQQQKNQLELAMLHAVFLTAAGAQLLDYWERLVRTPVAAGSPLDVYARKAALREFIDSIKDHIEQAKRAH
jgi:hypothetical protein